MLKFTLADYLVIMLAMFHYDEWKKSGAEPDFVDFRGVNKKDY
jgi:hypothetical protein